MTLTIDYTSATPVATRQPNAGSLTPNLDQARQFLNLVAADTPITFQTFDDHKGREDRRLIKVLHGPFDDHADNLARLNRQGAGIFYMVNEGDGVVRPGANTCRTAANVTRVRAHFVDLDEAPVDLSAVLAAPEAPHVIVESSVRKYHVYWLVDGCPLEQFSEVQKALIGRFGGDKVIHDLPRVMRVPGFWHQKEEPFQVRVAYQNGVEVD